MSKIVFVSLNTKDYTVDTGSVLKPDLVSGAEGPTGARSMRPSSAPARSTAAFLRYRHSAASQPEGAANQAFPRRGTEGSNPASSGRISYRGFGVYVLGDEAELAASFRGFAVGAAAQTVARDAIVRVPARQTAALSLLAVVAVPLTGVIWPLATEGPLLPQGPAEAGGGAALLRPTQRQPRMVEQLLGREIARLMAIENGPGDVGGEVGQPHEAGEVGAAQLLALRHIEELLTVAVDQLVAEQMGGRSA
jgi:hypothetical protein